MAAKGPDLPVRQGPERVARAIAGVRRAVRSASAQPWRGAPASGIISALGSRLSALGSRLSALGSRLSALGSRLLLIQCDRPAPLRFRRPLPARASLFPAIAPNVVEILIAVPQSLTSRQPVASRARDRSSRPPNPSTRPARPPLTERARARNPPCNYRQFCVTIASIFGGSFVNFTRIQHNVAATCPESDRSGAAGPRLRSANESVPGRAGNAPATGAGRNR